MRKRADTAKPLADVVGRVLTPACRKRGVANAALMLSPVDVFGAEFAGARVDRIVWPRGATIEGGHTGATLVVRADGATALALQHAAPQVIERVNVLIGWPAIARLRLTQTGVALRRAAAEPARSPPDARETEAVAARLGAIEHADLKAALSRLGANIAAKSLPGRGAVRK